MARIIGLDIGERRIGVAISDETQTIASVLDTIKAGDNASELSAIKELLSNYDVAEIVIGLPLMLNGSVGTAAQKVLSFADRLRQGLSVEVNTFDERFTTKQAHDLLLQADMSRKKRKGKVDRIAAQIMLQAYLDTKKAR